MAPPSSFTRSPPKPHSPTNGKFLLETTTTRPPPTTSTSRGASSQFSTKSFLCSSEGSGKINPSSGSFIMLLAGWLRTRSVASCADRSKARAANSAEKPVKIPLDPVRWNSVNSPRTWALEVSPRKRTTSSSALHVLSHHETLPKGSAMASPLRIATTFSSASGKTIPALPLPDYKTKNWGIIKMEKLNDWPWST